jgi:hypothetical protein
MGEATFEIFSAATADVHHFADEQFNALTAAYIELRRLGMQTDDRDRLWPQGPHEAPDWELVESMGDKIHDMVFEVEMISAVLRAARQEMALRSRPN